MSSLYNPFKHGAIKLHARQPDHNAGYSPFGRGGLGYRSHSIRGGTLWQLEGGEDKPIDDDTEEGRNAIRQLMDMGGTFKQVEQHYRGGDGGEAIGEDDDDVFDIHGNDNPYIQANTQDPYNKFLASISHLPLSERNQLEKEFYEGLVSTHFKKEEPKLSKQLQPLYNKYREDKEADIEDFYIDSLKHKQIFDELERYKKSRKELESHSTIKNKNIDTIKEIHKKIEVKEKRLLQIPMELTKLKSVHKPSFKKSIETVASKKRSDEIKSLEARMVVLNKEILELKNMIEKTSYVNYDIVLKYKDYLSKELESKDKHISEQQFLKEQKEAQEAELKELVKIRTSIRREKYIKNKEDELRKIDDKISTLTEQIQQVSKSKVSLRPVPEPDEEPESEPEPEPEEESKNEITIRIKRFEDYGDSENNIRGIDNYYKNRNKIITNEYESKSKESMAKLYQEDFTAYYLDVFKDKTNTQDYNEAKDISNEIISYGGGFGDALEKLFINKPNFTNALQHISGYTDPNYKIEDSKSLSSLSGIMVKNKDGKEEPLLKYYPIDLFDKYNVWEIKAYGQLSANTIDTVPLSYEFLASLETKKPDDALVPIADTKFKGYYNPYNKVSFVPYYIYGDGDDILIYDILCTLPNGNKLWCYNDGNPKKLNITVQMIEGVYNYNASTSNDLYITPINGDILGIKDLHTFSPIKLFLNGTNAGSQIYINKSNPDDKITIDKYYSMKGHEQYKYTPDLVYPSRGSLDGGKAGYGLYINKWNRLKIT